MPAAIAARFIVAGAIAAAVVSWSACADRLPEQDLRILQAVPVAKLSTDILWKEYQDDKRAADKRYWGKAVELSGKVSTVTQSPARLMFFAERGANAGVEARLLDERAKDMLAAANAGERVTLRCFCEGLQQGNVILKSCIKP